MGRYRNLIILSCSISVAGNIPPSRLPGGFRELMNRTLKRCVFVAGGAWGFSDKVYQRADLMLSLSEMTFNHQVIRIMFLEQLYRALTILRGEPYHHE